MGDPIHPLESFTAHTPEQARLLLDLNIYPVLGSVMRGVVSAGEVARASGQPLKRVHHQLTRLLAAGLVEVCGQRPRSGRPVRLYRARAGRYRVPFSLTDAATATELMQGITEPFMHAYTRAVAAQLISDEERDLLVTLSALGELQATVGDSRNSRNAVQGTGIFTQLNLLDADAAELFRRLHELRLWAGERRQPGGDVARGTPYLLGLALSPGALRDN